MSRGSGTRTATEERFRARTIATRRRRLGRALIGLLVLAVVAGLVWVVGFSTWLTARDVEVTGAHPADRTEIVSIAEEALGTPLARVDTSDLSARIGEQVPGVKKAELDRDWPHTLKVNVTSRVPELAVRQGDGRYLLLDIDGVAIRTVDDAPDDVPTVTAQDGANVTGHGVRAAQTMIEALPDDMRERVSDITVDEADQISFRLGDTEIVWGDAAEPDLKVKVISILLEEKTPQVIDVSAPRAAVTKG